MSSSGTKWMVIYERLEQMNVGDLIRKADLIDLVGDNFYAPLQRAARELLEAERRALVNVRGVGYRVAAAPEHAIIAEGHQRKASTSLRKGLNVVTLVRRNELSDSERASNDFMETMLDRFSRDMIAAGRKIDHKFDNFDRRLERLESVIGLPAEPEIIDVEEVPQEPQRDVG